MFSSSTLPNSKAIGFWLVICAAFVYLMVIVGGVTRLTQSGLSMVEWAPIMGVLPPIGEHAWREVFLKYQAFPEYQKINFGMSLEEFKNIFWWEYGHRVLGRLIGIIYLIPLLIFLAKGWVPAQWRLRLFVLFLLGGAQGVLGWYMVKSGLVDNPHVSQYRLTAHMGLAVIIFMMMWWFALSFLRGERQRTRVSSEYLFFTQLATFVVFLMILSGGFVAGTKAGFIMNTFPTMGGQWLPDGVLAMQPYWLNIFENPITIQFAHRLLAIIVSLTLIATVLKGAKQHFGSRGGIVMVLLVLQVSLGIAALIYVVPVVLGAAHQAGAVALLASVLYIAHRARYEGI